MDRKIRWKHLFMLVLLAYLCGLGTGRNASAKVIRITVDTADDKTTSSIQEYLNEAAEDSGNKYVIKVPKGRYTIQSCLRVYSNTTLDLGGSTFKINGHPLGGYLMQIGDSTAEPNGGYSKKRYSRGKNITIMNGTFDAGNALMEIGDMFTFSHAENITLRDLTFKAKPKKEPKYHMVECAAVRKVKFIGCRFLGNQNCRSALQLESTVKGVANMNSQGPEDGTRSSDITLSKCTFSDMEYAFGTNHGVSKDKYENITVEGCTFHKITKYAICAYNYRNCKIKGNHMKGCRGSLLLQQGSNSISRG